MSDEIKYFLDEEGVRELWEITKGNIGSSSKINPNILINADFRNPVNQNGQTEYDGTTSQWYMDKWRRFSIESNFVLTLNDGYITITPIAKSGTTYPGIAQYVTYFEDLRGKKVTLSALYKARGMLPYVEGTYHNGDCALELKANVSASAFSKIHFVNNDSWTLASCTGTVPKDITSYLEVNVAFYLGTSTPVEGMSVDLLAMKLELGSQQTLAYQDAEGNWQLNNPVDYETEYAKCAQYDPKTGLWVGYR